MAVFDLEWSRQLFIRSLAAPILYDEPNFQNATDPRACSVDLPNNSLVA